MKNYYFLFALVLVFAFLIRWKLFAYGDFLFFQDQSRDLLLVKEILEKGHVILIGARTGFGGLFHGPLWIYSLIPTYVLSNGNPYWSLMPVFMLVSIGQVVGSYFVGSKLFDRWTGLFFALFSAISLPLNESIYFMTNAHAMPLVFLFYLFFFIKYLRGSKNSLITIAFLIGIGIHIEAAFAFSLIPITLLAILYKKKIDVKTSAISAIVFVATISNYIVFEIRHGFLMTNSLLRLGKGGDGPLKGYENYQNLGFRIQDRIHGFIDSFAGIFYSQDTLSKVIIFGTLLLALIILIKTKEKKKEFRKSIIEYAFLLAFPALAFLFYVLYPYPLWSHYILALTVPLIFLFSIMLRVISKKPLGAVLVVFVITVAVIPPLRTIPEYYLTSKHDSTSDSSYKNQLSVAKWILSDSKNKPFNYLVYIPSTFTYGMDYLFTWNALVKEGQATSCKKDGLTYLIFYPPLEGDSGAHSFWKENVVKTKEAPIYSKKFKGGIIVEKFMIENDKDPIDPNYCQNLAFR